ncbi:type IIL restriction-modification enzyme MmeI [Adlercreutzia sp. ZJ141]|uniref:type IIL restriction-modification enzyme MmeI n=1 Tax=Adlercreutzia sp. ZJ141 TaxID=2709406 RepID=UPI0013EA56D9|nr:type IIL restriction-modification enzyme MmeI [Adlercreutzia sp. ZJ141]
MKSKLGSQVSPIEERIIRVKEFRSSSSREATKKLAVTPQLFGEIRQPETQYIFIPRHSSERRIYIPLGFLDSDIICGDSGSFVPDAELYHFGVMMSQFHNAWVRTVCGRLENRYRYSNKVVYNNFVWPSASAEQRQRIEKAAQAILDVRASYPELSLANLYDPDKMPADLLKAHKTLDAAVEAAYGVSFNGDEEKIVAHLFKLYAEATAESK